MSRVASRELTDIEGKDFMKLVDNALDIVDYLDYLRGIGETKKADHLLARWNEYSAGTIQENRRHVAKCPACEETFGMLTSGTRVAYLPIEENTITVNDRRGRIRRGNRRNQVIP